MSEHTSRVGQRVDKSRTTDDPHDDYRAYDPWTGEYILERDDEGEITSGLPVLLSTVIGNIVEKSVERYTVYCPECDTPARYDDLADPVCQQCGIICQGADETAHEQLVLDAKAAGRVAGSSTGNYA